MIWRPGIGLLVGQQLLGGEALMDLAMALPGDDLHVGLRRDILGQILVGNAEHRVLAEALDHLHRVRRGAADVALRLHVGRGVDIGDDRDAGIALAQQPHVGAGDRGGERAAGPHVRDQHQLVGIEQLRGLGHEVDAALDDDVGVGLRRLLGELQRVADDVGDAMEDLRRLVVVRQDHRVAGLLEVVDRLDVGRHHRPFDRRDDVLDLRVEVRRLARRPRRCIRARASRPARYLSASRTPSRRCLLVVD